LYRDTRNTQPTLYPDGKNHAIPSLHLDSFVAYRDSFVAVPASGNTTSPYCRAVSKHAAKIRRPALLLFFSTLTR
jgi:hypothetical protein